MLFLMSEVPLYAGYLLSNGHRPFRLHLFCTPRLLLPSSSLRRERWRGAPMPRSPPSLACPVLRDWYLIAEQPAPAPHLAHPEGCAATRIMLVTVLRVPLKALTPSRESLSRKHTVPRTGAGVVSETNVRGVIASWSMHMSCPVLKALLFPGVSS